MNKALVTGLTGQTGAYLAELLPAKGGEVHGIRRRTLPFNTARVDHLYQDPHLQNNKSYLRHGDQSATSNRIMGEAEPDEGHDQDATSHAVVSFESPDYKAGVNGIGVLRLAEAMRFTGLEKTMRFYRASTSESYGPVRETPRRETAPFHPRGPVMVTKLPFHWSER